MSWLPPGYGLLSELVTKHGIDHMRTQLYLGRHDVSRWNRKYGTIVKVSRGVWVLDETARWLETGETTRLIDPYSGSYQAYPLAGELLLVETGEVLLVGKVDDGYVPEIIAMMLAAVREFGITEDNPGSKDDLVKHFIGKVPLGGQPITPNLADPLATACRPASRMRGGNTKQKKKPTKPI
jgi:hypothetical protein